jgi:hypothetical protein
VRYTRKQRLHHHPAPSMAPPPCTCKTGALQLRHHVFQPHPALRDDSPAHSGAPWPVWTLHSHRRTLRTPGTPTHSPPAGLMSKSPVSLTEGHPSSFQAPWRASHLPTTLASPLRPTSSAVQSTECPPRRTRLSHAGVTSRSLPPCVSLLQDVIYTPPPPHGDVSVSGTRPPVCHWLIKVQSSGFSFYIPHHPLYICFDRTAPMCI